jgi:tetratricopeptide (TPR) repeat protein
VPASVQSLIQARLDRLDPADKAALQAASVLGQRFDLETLRHVLGQPGYGTGRLAERLLVRPEGEGFLFAHALVRDAVYDSLLKSRRRELHRRAADWYDERDAALRAEHLDRAEDPEAARAYLTAARAQVAAYHHELALRLAERGLELAGERADHFALGCLRGDALHDLGQMPAALSAYEGALAAASGEAERCQALIGLAAVKRVTDDLSGAFADLERAETAAAALGLTAERARIHFLRGNLCFPRGDIEGCLREHGRSLELAREAGTAEQEAAALGGLGDAEYVRGRVVSAHEAFRRCAELCRQRGLGRIEIANRPMVAFTRWLVGDTRGAIAEALAAIAAAAKVGQLRAQTIAHHAACFCYHSLLDWPEAWRHAEAALALARQLGARRFEAEALALRAELHRLAGRRSEALADVEEALAISRETGMAFIGPVILGVLALTTEDATVLGTALAEGEALLAAGSISHNHLLFRRDAIEACLHVGAWDGAERHAGALEDYARQEPSPWTEFVVARGRALAAHGRGTDIPTLTAELKRLRSEGERLEHLGALSAIDAALAARPASAPADEVHALRL